MKYTKGGIEGNTGEALTLEVNGPAAAPAKQPDPPKPDAPTAQPPADRLRVSCWVGDVASAIGRWTDIKTGKFQQDLSMIQNAKGVLDDVSAVSTIWMSKEKKVTWKVDSSKQFIQKAVDACHENGIQLLVGYAIADEGSAIGGRSKLFTDWVNNPVGPTPEQHAADIMEFLNPYAVDGIGFDLELNGLKAANAETMTRFYHALADLLAAKNQLLTIATGIGAGGKEEGILGTFRAQPFSIAKGKDNIIIRPMAYDMFKMDDGQFLQFHKDIVNYGLNTAGLKPGQLQLGLKTIKNTPVPGFSDKPGSGWSLTKCTMDAQGVADRCRLVLKPFNVGVINFAGFTDFKTINAVLNAGGKPSNTVGSPLQVPLTQAVAKGAAPAPAAKKEDPAPAPQKEQPPEDPNAVKSREEYANTPQEMRERYLHMKFTIPELPEEIEFTLECLRYHNNGLKHAGEHDVPGQPSYIGDRQTVSDTVGGIKKAIKKLKGDEFYKELVGEYAKEEKIILPSPFYGKGAPTQIETVLKIVGWAMGPGQGKVGKVPAPYWKDKGSLAESLKDFYFNNMGLDCSGFAGNYARFIAQKPEERIYPSFENNHYGLGPNLPIPEFGRTGKKRTALNQIMMGDLMVWKSGGHIATVMGHDGGDIQCVESNGDSVVKGLGAMIRKVKNTGGDEWTLTGGGVVYIVSFVK